MTKARERPLDDAAPCVGCGLCCDGTLYVRGQVAPGEESRVAESGAELLTYRGGRFFRQPCPHHNCGRCSIYDDRFAICHSFRCKLLERYHAGQIDLSEARGTIEGAMALLREVKAGQPSANLYVERKRMRGKLKEELQSAVGGERERVARRLLKLIETDAYLERWFRDDEDGTE